MARFTSVLQPVLSGIHACKQARTQDLVWGRLTEEGRQADKGGGGLMEGVACFNWGRQVTGGDKIDRGGPLPRKNAVLS